MTVERVEGREYVPSRRADSSKVDGLKSCAKRDERDRNKRLEEIESHLDDLSELIILVGKKFVFTGEVIGKRDTNKLETLKIIGHPSLYVSTHYF